MTLQPVYESAVPVIQMTSLALEYSSWHCVESLRSAVRCTSKCLLC